ncbi:hypothetical protein KIN20_009090 [Parelaphostrongylus tenuis]|uniref:Uncharacterized protein n=1 Tax=Parelaphostrongylus tenuis TaxID=148309 RepID=A0AAD5M8Z1_PARTN|nr:hypothetical protein KIN20_009090 [Parelaphostrongylus tenuis]
MPTVFRKIPVKPETINQTGINGATGHDVNFNVAIMTSKTPTMSSNIYINKASTVMRYRVNYRTFGTVSFISKTSYSIDPKLKMTNPLRYGKTWKSQLLTQFSLIGEP